MAMQNSNPTILSAADLPTRQRKSRHSAAKAESQYTGGIFTHELQPTSALLHDPFAGSYVNGPPSESESDDDDLMEEPIDEQEIYGTRPQFPAQFPAIYIYSTPQTNQTLLPQT